MSEYCKYCGQKYNDLRSLVLNSCLHNPNGRHHEPYEARRIIAKYGIADWDSLKDTEDWPAWLDQPADLVVEPLDRGVRRSAELPEAEDARKVFLYRGRHCDEV